MNPNTDESAVGRLRRNDIVIEKILSNLSPSDAKRSRYLSLAFNQEVRGMMPRCIGQGECQYRLRERLGPHPDSELVGRYYDAFDPPTNCDRNVIAMSIDPEQHSYTLPQTLKVYPNVETFYANGATVDRITDRLWIIRSDMGESAARTALIDKLTTGFFSDHALSHCPEVQLGSKLALRNTHRLKRLMNKDKMKGSRYYRCTLVEPVHGPRYLLGEDTASVYSIGAFNRLMDAHASHSWGPAHSIETIEYAPRTLHRLSLYRRFARSQLHVFCHGNITVKISSPDHAPNYFDLISDPTFPGDLGNVKQLVVDASLGPAPRFLPNVSRAYSSPHLESVTFRLQDRPADDARTYSAVGVAAGSGEESEEELQPEPEDLARPLYGSTVGVIYTPGPGSDHLAEVCHRATINVTSHPLS